MWDRLTDKRTNGLTITIDWPHYIHNNNIQNTTSYKMLNAFLTTSKDMFFYVMVGIQLRISQYSYHCKDIHKR